MADGAKASPSWAANYASNMLNWATRWPPTFNDKQTGESKGVCVTPTGFEPVTLRLGI